MDPFLVGTTDAGTSVSSMPMDVDSANEFAGFMDFGAPVQMGSDAGILSQENTVDTSTYQFDFSSMYGGMSMPQGQW